MAAGLKQIEDQAQGTQFQIALYPGVSALKANPNDPAANATAEAGFRKAMEQYPDSGALRLNWPRSASNSRAPRRQGPAGALLLCARRIGPDSGVGSLEPANQKSLDDYLKRIYTVYHGSDEGLVQLKELAAKSPNPPADFKVKTSREIATEAEEEFKTKNPQLATWMGVKASFPTPTDSSISTAS